MGEYARAYTLERFGVDIGEDDDRPQKTKRDWKWSCKKCSKPLGSEQANKDHMRDKHGISAEQGFTPIASKWEAGRMRINVEVTG